MEKGPAREVARDITGPLCNNRLDSIKKGYSALYGKYPTNDEVVSILKSNVERQEADNTREA